MSKIQSCALGDNFIKDNANEVNQALKMLKAPFYINCSPMKSTGSRDYYKISWRRFSTNTCVGVRNNRGVKKMEIEKWGKKNLTKGFSLSKLMNTPKKYAEELMKFVDVVEVQKTTTAKHKAAPQVKEVKPGRIKLLKSQKPRSKMTELRSIRLKRRYADDDKNVAYYEYVKKNFFPLKKSFMEKFKSGEWKPEDRKKDFNYHLLDEFEKVYKGGKAEEKQPKIHREKKVREPKSEKSDKIIKMKPIKDTEYYKKLMKLYNRNEENNYHGENAELIVKEFGTPEELETIKDINERSSKRRYISNEDHDLRYLISNKYFQIFNEAAGETYNESNERETPVEKIIEPEYVPVPEPEDIKIVEPEYIPEPELIPTSEPLKPEMPTSDDDMKLLQEIFG